MPTCFWTAPWSVFCFDNVIQVAPGKKIYFWCAFESMFYCFVYCHFIIHSCLFRISLFLCDVLISFLMRFQQIKSDQFIHERQCHTFELCLIRLSFVWYVKFFFCMLALTAAHNLSFTITYIFFSITCKYK